MSKYPLACEMIASNFCDYEQYWESSLAYQYRFQSFVLLFEAQNYEMLHCMRLSF